MPLSTNDRTCPWCGEQIKQAAIICRFCHNDVTPRGEETARRMIVGEAPAPAPADPAGRAIADASEGSGVHRLSKYVPPAILEGIIEGASGIDEGERRPIAILFSDLSGFTSLTEEIGAESMAEFLGVIYGRIKEIVESYGGIVEKFIGDAAMALFGAPISHGDDPERAIRAALEIRDAVLAVARRHGHGLDVHGGIAFGEVVFKIHGDRGDIDSQTIGKAVNLASRLQAFAKPGETLVDHRIYQQTRTTFDWDELEPLNVKGLQRPIRAHKVTGVRKRFSKVALGERIEMVPLVGRQAELNLLTECADRLSEGQGSVTIVRGEAGVGKSRLVYELYQRIREENCHWFTGRCLSFGTSIPHLPFTELLRSMLGLARLEEGPVSEKDMRGAVKRCFASGTRRARSTPGRVQAKQRAELAYQAAAALLSVDVASNPLQALPARERREQIFNAFTELIGELVRHRPTILVFEDFHWADPDSFELLDHLIFSLQGKALMIVVLTRPEMAHHFPLEEGFNRLSLEELPAKESELLLERLLHVDRLPRSLRNRILEKTEGNPFYIEEVVLSLEEHGVLRRRGEGYQIAGPVEMIEIPDTVEGVVLARLDRLERRVKSVIQCASVIGQEFRHRTLEQVTAIGEGLQSRLAVLMDGEYVLQEVMIPEIIYIFRHVVLRDVTYRTLLHRRRRHFHAKVAEALVALYADRVEEFVEVIAHHFEQGRVLDQAAIYLEQAADKSEALCANHAAIDHWRRLLNVLDNADLSGGERRRLLVRANLRLAELGRRVGDLDLALRGAKEAHGAALSQRDHRSAARALRWKGEAHRLLGDAESGSESLREALQLARRSRDAALIADVQNMLGHFARMRGDTAEAKCAFQAVLRYAEKRGDRKARAQALNHLGILHMIAGEHSEAIGQMTEALALTREIGRHNEAVMITINLGIIHVRRGEVSKGRQRLAAALTRAEKMEFERGVQLAMTALVDLHLCTGDFRRALHLSGRLLHRAEEGEFADVVGIALSNRARAAMELGKIKDAERDVVKALSLTRADVHHGGLVDCLSVRAELDLRQDNPRAALKAAKEMMAVVEKHGETEHLANAQALVARAQLALGRRKAAAEMADAAVATAKRRQVPRDEGWAVWAKGLCARAARDESALRRAAKQSHQLGCEAGDAALVAAAEALGKDD